MWQQFVMTPPCGSVLLEPSPTTNVIENPGCCDEAKDTSPDSVHECKKTIRHQKALSDSPSLAMDLRWVAHDAEGINSTHWASSSFAHVKTKERMHLYANESEGEDSDSDQPAPPSAKSQQCQDYLDVRGLPSIPQPCWPLHGGNFWCW